MSLPKIADPHGNLTFIEGKGHVPFEIKRVFYLYGIPEGATRAGHALRSCEQFIVAVSGSFQVLVDDGRRRARFQLDRPDLALYLPAKIWREIAHFSAGAICLVLASEVYDEASYYRDYTEFCRDVS